MLLGRAACECLLYCKAAPTFAEAEISDLALLEPLCVIAVQPWLGWFLPFVYVCPVSGPCLGDACVTFDARVPSRVACGLTDM